MTCVLGEDTDKTDEYEAKRKKVEDVLALDEPPTVKPPEVCVWVGGWVLVYLHAFVLARVCK